MDILIKSFNRPYYLDRCLYSIQKFGINFKGNIYIIDDGTPKPFLDKIQKKYPTVKILKSEFYEEKARLITNAEPINNVKIPIDLWISSASIASDYFLLLEDDIWFTKPFDFEFYERVAVKENWALLKLFWLGNPKLISGKTLKSEKEYLHYQPHLTTLNPILFKIIFNLNRFGFHKLMEFLKFYTEDKFLKYYAIYSVAGAVFKKEYFLKLWKNHQSLVDEKLQIKNAVKYVYSNKDVQFARTTAECVSTGFSSSATNKKENPIAIDMFKVNKLLNEAWLSDDFNTLQNLNEDLDAVAISRVLTFSESECLISPMEWKEWVLHFKNQFRAVGCEIE